MIPKRSTEIGKVLFMTRPEDLQKKGTAYKTVTGRSLGTLAKLKRTVRGSGTQSNLEFLTGKRSECPRDLFSKFSGRRAVKYYAVRIADDAKTAMRLLEPPTDTL